MATFTTRAFRRPRVIAGPIDATLYATSNRPDTELVATIDDVAPGGHSTPLTSGALLGSFRKLDRPRSWLAGDGRPLLPYHPYTRSSQRPVRPGAVTRYDLEVFPTFAQLQPGHRLRLRVATSDVPHLVPTAAEAASLAGGAYSLEHNRRHASFLEVATAPSKAFRKPCGLCR